jgi:hypothetical protein
MCKRCHLRYRRDVAATGSADARPAVWDVIVRVAPTVAREAPSAWRRRDFARGSPADTGCCVEAHQGAPDAKLIVLICVEGEDAKRLERISEARGKKVADVVTELPSIIRQVRIGGSRQPGGGR